MHWGCCLDAVLATVQGYMKLERRKSDVKQASIQSNHHSEEKAVLVPRIHSFWSIFLFATRAAHFLLHIRPHFQGGIRIN
jgi:hypothetical protein